MSSAPRIRERIVRRLRGIPQTRDPWGIGRRTIGFLLSFSIRRAARGLFYLLRGTEFERPVFIMGSPRSGTSTLFRLLRSSAELGSLGREGYAIWSKFHHPRATGWHSEAVGAGQVRWGERRFVNAYFRAHVQQNRFVEKTPPNIFRVPHLLDLFPDAYFLEIRRDPCDVINSHIKGWRHPWRFVGYFVPEKLEIPGYPLRRHWRFSLIEGWRELRSSPIHEIAFAQWAACVRALAEARGLVDPRRWACVYLEDLVADPRRTMDRICEHIEIAATDELRLMAEQLAREPVNALTGPARHKWRNENRDEILELMPRIVELAPVAGYRMRRDQAGEWQAEPAPPDSTCAAVEDPRTSQPLTPARAGPPESSGCAGTRSPDRTSP
jgi:hypothetical protein